MTNRKILWLVFVALALGGLVGYLSAPAPDYTPYEDQIAELDSQITSLQNEIIQLQSQVSSLQNQLDSKVLIEVPSSWTYLEVNISPRKPEFQVGEIVTFKIECSHPYNNSYFKIWDPNGSLIWRSDYLTEWITIDGYWFVPYIQQLSDGEPMLLGNNCTLGTWSWVWNSETKSVLGFFEVIEGEQVR